MLWSNAQWKVYCLCFGWHTDVGVDVVMHGFVWLRHSSKIDRMKFLSSFAPRTKWLGPSRIPVEFEAFSIRASSIFHSPEASSEIRLTNDPHSINYLVINIEMTTQNKNFINFRESKPLEHRWQDRISPINWQFLFDQIEEQTVFFWPLLLRKR